MMKVPYIFLVLLLTILVPVDGLSEVITLKNGTVIEGTIVERTENKIRIDTGVGIPITYYMDEIEQQENARTGWSEKKVFSEPQESTPTPVIGPLPICSDVLNCYESALFHFDDDPIKATAYALKARFYANYDIKRVADPSSHQAWVYIEDYLFDIYEWAVYHPRIYKQILRDTVQWAKTTPPPDYRPDWMVNHGIRFMISSLEGKPPQEPYKPDHDPVSDWAKTVSEFEKFLYDEESWREFESAIQPENVMGHLKSRLNSNIERLKSDFSEEEFTILKRKMSDITETYGQRKGSLGDRAFAVSNEASAFLRSLYNDYSGDLKLMMAGGNKRRYGLTKFERLGLWHYQNREYEKTVKLLKKAMEKDPELVHLHQHLGSSYLALGDIKSAHFHFMRANDQMENVNDPKLKALLGFTFLSQGDHDSAEMFLKKAIEIDPNLPEPYEDLARIYYDQKKYDLADQNLRKAQKIYSFQGRTNESARINESLSAVKEAQKAKMPWEVIKEAPPEKRGDFIMIYAIWGVGVLSVLGFLVRKRAYFKSRFKDKKEIMEHASRALDGQLRDWGNNNRELEFTYEDHRFELIDSNRIYYSGKRSYFESQTILTLNLGDELTLYFFPKYRENRFSFKKRKEQKVEILGMPKLLSKFNVYTNNETRARYILSEIVPVRIFESYVQPGVLCDIALEIKEGVMKLDLDRLPRKVKPTLQEVFEEPRMIYHHAEQMIKLSKLLT